ncbi:hypothetical protein AGMMS50262_05750 [Bacteroidia bacterium]|nr:hypothetical protein AGMMS50262_05750 [Bacteroidia bacterium]
MTVFLLLFILPACDEEYYSPIPASLVEITLDLYNQDSDLVPTLATKSFIQPQGLARKVGFGGVVVINGYGEDLSINLYAYDLACPNEPSIDKNIRVVPGDAGQAVCPKCKGVYNLDFGKGLPEKGGKYPLKSYLVRKSNTGINKYVIMN